MKLELTNTETRTETCELDPGAKDRQTEDKWDDNGTRREKTQGIQT